MSWKFMRILILASLSIFLCIGALVYGGISTRILWMNAGGSDIISQYGVDDYPNVSHVIPDPKLWFGLKNGQLIEIGLREDGVVVWRNVKK